MQKPLIIVLPLIILISAGLDFDESEPPIIECQGTGIILDTLNNEVEICFLENQPEYYVAHIFTPVCNTGECLPVKINIYWDLCGNYLKFDQEEGEILTKLDHAPFTDEDYQLLDEILKGPDPRIIRRSKHLKGKKNNQSSPSPDYETSFSKYDMVDGITGSTLPEVKEKFVPGALYTTYTLYGLANDFKSEILHYTQSHLLQSKYYPSLIKSPNQSTQSLVLNHLIEKDGNQLTSRTNVLIALLDTGSYGIKLMALDYLYPDDYNSPQLQSVLEKSFDLVSFRSFRNKIIDKWIQFHCPDKVLLRFSRELPFKTSYFTSLMRLFESKNEWPDGVFSNLIEAYPKLSEEYQTQLKEMLTNRKKLLEPQEWKVIKKL